jgi:hypothetical protein
MPEVKTEWERLGGRQMSMLRVGDSGPIEVGEFVVNSSSENNL